MALMKIIDGFEMLLVQQLPQLIRIGLFMRPLNTRVLFRHQILLKHPDSIPMSTKMHAKAIQIHQRVEMAKC